MPPALLAIVPAVIGAGVAINSASQQKKAADAGLAAQTAANDKSLAAQQAARDQITQLQAPFQQGGELGMAALLERLGLTHNGTPTGQPAQPAADPYFGYNINPAARAGPSYTDSHTIVDPMTAPKSGSAGVSPAVPDTGQGVRFDGGAHVANLLGNLDGPSPNPASGPTPQGGQSVPDWNAFLQANPDVMQWAQSGHGDPNVPIEQQSIAQRAAYWMQNAAAMGDPRGSQPLPMTTVGNDNAAQTPGPQAPQAPDLTNAPRPDAPPVPAFTRPDTGTAPDPNSYFGPGAFHEDPGFQFALAQGQRNLNANFAARGLLKSGSAIQGAIDYGQGMADQQYGNFFNRQNTLYGNAVNVFNSNRANTNQNYENDRGYGTNLALNTRDFNNNNFTADRQYQTNQNNTATGNLFSLTQIGQNAAGAVGGAGQSYANNASNIFGSQADAASAAANARAQANAGMVGSIGGAASNLFNTFPGFQTPIGAPQTVGNAYPVVTAQTPPTFPNGPLTTYNPPVF